MFTEMASTELGIGGQERLADLEIIYRRGRCETKAQEVQRNFGHRPLVT